MPNSAFHLMGHFPHEQWMDTAICKFSDPAIFFPENGVKATEAKAICSNCIHQTQCLNYALAHNIKDGVWGGASERDRRKLLATRR